MAPIKQFTVYDVPPPVFDAVEAKRLADEGMERARRAHRVTIWKLEADAWLATLAPGTVFTADELVAAVGLPDIGPTRNNVVGAWFSAKSKSGQLRFENRMRKSKRPERHGNANRVWSVV